MPNYFPCMLDNGHKKHVRNVPKLLFFVIDVFKKSGRAVNQGNLKTNNRGSIDHWVTQVIR